MSRVPALPQYSMQELEKTLICAVSNGIVFSTCSSRHQTVPRRLPLKGIPKRVAYIQHLKKLVVAVEKVDITVSRTRRIRPAIEIVDVDPREDAGPDEPAPNPYAVGKVGERITCIIHWKPKLEGKQYGMIVVGTMAETTDMQSCDGRLVFLTANLTAEGIRVEPKKPHTFKGRPVHSVESFGNDSLVVGLGQTLLLMSLGVNSRKWVRKAEYRLPSSPLHISVIDSVIHVTTSKHSLLRFQFSNNQFVLTGSDDVSRYGISHTMLHCGPAMASQGIGGAVITGFQGTGRSPQPLFEACLSQNITRLRKASSRSTEAGVLESFYGSTLDARMYHFSTLSPEEWRLFHFVQALLCRPNNPLAARSMILKHLRKLEAPTLLPTERHIDGDALIILVSNGSAHLQELLLKDEEEGLLSKEDVVSLTEEKATYFNDLVRSTLGDTADPVASFMVWAQQLLGMIV